MHTLEPQTAVQQADHVHVHQAYPTLGSPVHGVLLKVILTRLIKRSGRTTTLQNEQGQYKYHRETISNQCVDDIVPQEIGRPLNIGYILHMWDKIESGTRITFGGCAVSLQFVANMLT